MFLRTLTENNVLFYDENKYKDFLYDVSHGFYCDDTSQESSYSDAHFVCNIGIVMANIANWKRCIPKVQLNFKVCSNYDARLVRILKDCEIQFSVSSSAEIVNLLNLGIETTAMLFNSRVKYNQQFIDASVNEVNFLSAGTPKELERIALLHSNAKILLRCSIMNDYFVRLLKRSIELGITVVGLCYEFPDNQNDSMDCYYDNCFDNLASIVNSLSLDYNITINLLNLGSKIPLFDEEVTSPFQQFARCANRFTALFEDIKVIAEPTSFMFEAATQLCCNVMGVRSIYDPVEKENKMFYYLNDGIYGSLSNIVYHNYTPVVEILQKESFQMKVPTEKVETFPSTFWGPTCDNMDNISSKERFPLLSLGDTVTFVNLGLYNHSCATNFNGFNIPKMRFIFSYQKLESLGIANDAEAVTMLASNANLRK